MTLPSKWISLLLICWVILCLGGFLMLWNYANTPGVNGQPNTEKNFILRLQASTEKPTLILFAHPRCPCTRATFSEVERLQADYKDYFSTTVVFYEPLDSGSEWQETDLWKRAHSMYQTEIIADQNGELSLAAGATTSGQIGLVDSNGNLLFWGGITPSRGHEGQSSGGIAIRALLRGHEPGNRRTSVFGCSLRTESPDLNCTREENCCELTDS